MYRPPDTGTAILITFRDMLEKAATEGKEMIIMGDLNCNVLAENRNGITKELLLISEDYRLSQLISEMTRVTEHSQSLIDLLFSSNPEKFRSVGVTPCAGSDHLMIYGERAERLPTLSREILVRIFRRCDHDELLSELECAPWHVLDIFTSIDDKWSCWMNLFLNIIDRHSESVYRRRVSNEWIDRDIHKLMRARNYFRRKHRRSRAQKDWDTYKLLCKEVRSRLRRAKSEYFSNLCQDVNNQPSKLWKHLNSTLGRKTYNPITSIIDKGQIITDMEDILNRFASHFSHPVVTSHDINISLVAQTPFSFHFSEISEDNVQEALNTLNEVKATGPDGISAKLLRMTSSAIAASLTSLFNASLESGRFPDSLKEANITPVFKRGDKQIVGNYRPISIIPTIAKVFETLVHSQLYKYLHSNNLLSPNQSGFRPHYSTQKMLLATVDEWR